ERAAGGGTAGHAVGLGHLERAAGAVDDHERRGDAVGEDGLEQRAASRREDGDAHAANVPVRGRRSRSHTPWCVSVLRDPVTNALWRRNPVDLNKLTTAD